MIGVEIAIDRRPKGSGTRPPSQLDAIHLFLSVEQRGLRGLGPTRPVQVPLPLNRSPVGGWQATFRRWGHFDNDSRGLKKNLNLRLAVHRSRRPAKQELAIIGLAELERKRKDNFCRRKIPP